MKVLFLLILSVVTTAHAQPQPINYEAHLLQTISDIRTTLSRNIENPTSKKLSDVLDTAASLFPGSQLIPRNGDFGIAIQFNAMVPSESVLFFSENFPQLYQDHAIEIQVSLLGALSTIKILLESSAADDQIRIQSRRDLREHYVTYQYLTLLPSDRIANNVKFQEYLRCGELGPESILWRTFVGRKLSTDYDLSDRMQFAFFAISDSLTSDNVANIYRTSLIPEAVNLKRLINRLPSRQNHPIPAEKERTLRISVQTYIRFSNYIDQMVRGHLHELEEKARKPVAVEPDFPLAHAEWEKKTALLMLAAQSKM